MRVTGCRKLLDDAKAPASYVLMVADDPSTSGVEQLTAEPVVAVNLDLEARELTLHTEPELHQSADNAEPIALSSLLALLAADGADESEVLWVGAYRALPAEGSDGDYSVRLAIPTVGLAIVEDHEAAVIFRAADAGAKASLTRWRQGL